ncbi:MAG: hypothetical protein KH142_08850 [Slackia piriformis]|uniref:Uncharacterized protein n=1 Tax=Slackia piriformis TaxID=626934 RepID=A0A943UUI8_9ACTN|nr:hypothetical protein [Slackia piriformis]
MKETTIFILYLSFLISSKSNLLILVQHVSCRHRASQTYASAFDGGAEIEQGDYATPSCALSSRKHRETSFTQFHAIGIKVADMGFYEESHLRESMDSKRIMQAPRLFRSGRTAILSPA